MKKKVMFVVAVATLAVGQAMAQSDCRSAEEAISEMSVNVAEAYAAGDFDKAAPLLRKAAESSKTGNTQAKECGCAKVQEPLGKADELLKEAQGAGGQFTDVQDRLYAVIGQSETARRAAEACWRAKVAVKK